MVCTAIFGSFSMGNYDKPVDGMFFQWFSRWLQTNPFAAEGFTCFNVRFDPVTWEELPWQGKSRAIFSLCRDIGDVPLPRKHVVPMSKLPNPASRAIEYFHIFSTYIFMTLNRATPGTAIRWFRLQLCFSTWRKTHWADEASGSPDWTLDPLRDMLMFWHFSSVPCCLIISFVGVLFQQLP